MVGFDHNQYRRMEAAQEILDTLEETGRDPTEEELETLYHAPYWRETYSSYSGASGDCGEEAAKLTGELIRKHCPSGGKILLGGGASLALLSEIPEDILANSRITIVTGSKSLVRAAKYLAAGIDIRFAEDMSAAGLMPKYYDIGIFPGDMVNAGAEDEIKSRFNAISRAISSKGVFYIQSTAAGFMDNTNKGVQRYIQDLENNVELRGGVRKQYKNTHQSWSSAKITLDHLVFCNRAEPQHTTPDKHFYANLVSTSIGKRVNVYFEKEPAGSLDAKLAVLASSTPDRIFGANYSIDAEVNRKTNEAEEETPLDVAPGDYILDEEGRVRRNIGGKLALVDVYAEDRSKLVSMIELRDLYRQAFELRVGESREDFEEARGNLLRRYEDFVEKHGDITNTMSGKVHTLVKYFRGASDGAALQHLEKEYQVYKEGGDKSIFAVEHVPRTPVIMGDLEEGVKICFRETGGVFPDQIASNLDRTLEEVEKELTEKRLAFINPDTKMWEPAEVYLSGDIRGKVERARIAAISNPAAFSANIEALEANIPAPLDIDKVLQVEEGVDTSAGGVLAKCSPWIPPELLGKFVSYALNDKDIRVNRDENGMLRVTAASSGARNRGRASVKKEKDVFASTYRSSAEILRFCLSGVQPAFNPDNVAYPANATAEMKQEIEESHRADHDLVGRRMVDLNKFFVEWANGDKEIKEQLSAAYNNALNRYVPRKPDLERVQLSGLNPSYFTPDEHQIRAIARGISQDGLIVHHSPMLGKTFVMAGIANERWNIDPSTKIAMVVPKETFRQTVAEIKKAFPLLPIGVCGPKDLTQMSPEESLRAVRLQAGGLVIMTPETFNDIPLPKSVEIAPLTKRIADKQRSLVYGQGRRSAEADQKVWKEIAVLQEKVKEIMERREKIAEDISSFDFQGIMFDEAHIYRNLTTNAPGGEGMSGASRSDRLRDKLIFLRKFHAEKYQGTGREPFFTVLATGTMTGRKAVDIFNFIDLTSPEMLEACNINSATAFLNTFARPATSFRGDPSRPGEMIRCTSYQLEPSPELMQLLSTVADTVYAGDVPRVVKTKPKLVGGKATVVVCPRSKAQDAYYADIVKRAQDGMAPGETLSLYNEALRVAVDARLIDPRHDEDPNSKVNQCARNILDLYQRTGSLKGCQLVFCENYAKKAEDPSKVLMRDLWGAMGWSRKRGTDEHKAHLEAAEKLEAVFTAAGIEAFKAPGQFPHPAFQKTPQMDVVTKEIEKNAAAILTPEENKILKKVLNDLLRGDKWLSCEYNLFRDLQQKLIAGGIPKKEIAIVSELPAGQREIAKAKANTGEIRVLLGSRDVLGKGVNIQTRMAGDHSLDVTWNPDEEWQAQERGPRVGNIFPVFERYKYVTQNSGEEIVALRNEQKQRSSVAIWEGNVFGAAKRDALENLTSTAELTSVISGDYRTKLRGQLQTLISSMEDKIRGATHERKQALKEIPEAHHALEREWKYYRDDLDMIRIVSDFRKTELPTLAIEVDPNEPEVDSKDEKEGKGGKSNKKSSFWYTVNGKERKFREIRNNVDNGSTIVEAIETGNKMVLFHGQPLAKRERREKSWAGGHYATIKTVCYLEMANGELSAAITEDRDLLGALRSMSGRIAAGEKRVAKARENAEAVTKKLSLLYHKATDVEAGVARLQRITAIRDHLIEQINDKSSEPWERDEEMAQDEEKIAKRLKLGKHQEDESGVEGKRGEAFANAFCASYRGIGRFDENMEKIETYVQGQLESKTVGEPIFGVEKLGRLDLMVAKNAIDRVREIHKENQAKNRWGSLYDGVQSQLVASSLEEARVAYAEEQEKKAVLSKSRAGQKNAGVQKGRTKVAAGR